MPLDSHFATTVCGAGYSPRYLHSVSHVVRQDPHRLWTRHWGQMTWEFLLSHLFQAGHPLCGTPMLPTGTDVRGKAGLTGNTLVQSSSQEKH